MHAEQLRRLLSLKLLNFHVRESVYAYHIQYKWWSAILPLVCMYCYELPIMENVDCLMDGGGIYECDVEKVLRYSPSSNLYFVLFFVLLKFNHSIFSFFF